MQTHEEIYNDIYTNTKRWLIEDLKRPDDRASRRANIIAVLMTHTAFLERNREGKKHVRISRRS